MIIPNLFTSAYGMTAKTKINTDISNRELVEKVEALLDERQRKEDAGRNKRKNPARIMHVEYGDEGAREAFERRRSAILKAIAAIDGEEP